MDPFEDWKLIPAMTEAFAADRSHLELACKSRTRGMVGHFFQLIGLANLRHSDSLVIDMAVARLHEGEDRVGPITRLG